MAVNLVKPEPHDARVDTVEAAAPPPRLRCVARPRLGPYHAFDEHGLAAVKTGTKVIIRCAATLIRRGWGITVVHMRKTRAKSTKATPAADATKAKGGKKPPPKSGTADLVVGGLLVAGMGVVFVTRTLIPAAIGLVGDAASWVAEHPVIALRGTGIVVIIYVVIAWTVGGVVGPSEDHKEEDHGGADGEATETDTPEGRDEAPANKEVPTDSGGGEPRAPCPSPAAFIHLLHDLVEEHSEGDKRTPGLHWPQVVAGLSSRYPGGGSSGGWSAADCRALCKAAAVPTSPGTRARGEGACKGVSTGVRTADLPPRPSSPSPGPSQEGPPGLGVAVVSAGQIQQQGQQQQQQQGASNSGESAADWIVQDEDNPAHWLVQR